MPPSETQKPRKWASNALFSPHFRLGDQRGDQELDLSSLGNSRGQGYKASPWEHPGHLAAMTLYLKRMSPPPQPCESRTSPLLDLCLCLCLFSYSHPKALRLPWPPLLQGPYCLGLSSHWKPSFLDMGNDVIATIWGLAL